MAGLPDVTQIIVHERPSNPKEGPMRLMRMLKDHRVAFDGVTVERLRKDAWVDVPDRLVEKWEDAEIARLPTEEEEELTGVELAEAGDVAGGDADADGDKDPDLAPWTMATTPADYLKRFPGGPNVELAQAHVAAAGE